LKDIYATLILFSFNISKTVASVGKNALRDN